MKKLIFLIVLAFLSYCNTIMSQPTIFSKVLFSETIAVQVNALTNSFDNGYLLVGNKDYQNGMIIKIDFECNQIWFKEIVHTNTIYYPSIELNSIIRTNDSCFFISGYARNTVTEKQDALCMKITGDGDTLWITTIGGDDNKNILSSCQTYDSGFIISGMANTIGDVRSVFIAKLDLSGNILWTRSIRLGNSYNKGYSIKQLPDSSYLVTGSMSNSSPYESYPLLLNLSETGDINWAKKYITSDLRGKSNDFIITDTGVLLYLDVSAGVSFLQTDFEGNIMWDKSYDLHIENFFNDVYSKLHRTSDNFLIGAVSGGFWGGRMFKLDLEANALWFSNLFLYATNVTETIDGEYLVYGNGPIMGVKNMEDINPQIGFIQMDTMGNGTECVYIAENNAITNTILCDNVFYTTSSEYTVSNIPIELADQTLSLRDGCVDMTGGVDDEDTMNALIIYPNPTTGIFNISLQNQETGNLTIFNNFGQIIFQNNIIKGTKMDLSSQPHGVYYYLFKDGDGKQFSGKLVKIY